MESSFSDAYRHFAIQRQDDVTIVHIRDFRLHDPLDIAEIQDELTTFVELQQPNHLLLNFGAVIHCSSEMIGILLHIRRRVLRYGGDVGICGLREALREAYRIMNLDGTVFRIYDSATDAVSLLSRTDSSIAASRPKMN